MKQTVQSYAKTVLWPAAYLALFTVCGALVPLWALSKAMGEAFILSINPVAGLYVFILAFWISIGTILRTGYEEPLTLKGFLSKPGLWG